MLLNNFVLQATTFVVSNANDAGAGSLRQAITDANADVNAPHLINFSIPSGSTINLTNALPVISRTVVIDATTAAGYTANGVGVNLTTGSGIDNGLEILNTAAVEVYGFQIYGFNNGIVVTGNSAGFKIGAPNKRNFINRCSNTQISIDGADNGFIQNNYIGCNVAGTAGYYDDPPAIHTNNGIDLINGANNNLIGGTANGQGNLIGGGTGRAFNIGEYFGAANTGSSNNLIYGNRIGGIGIEFYTHAFWIDGNSDNNFIGGVLPGQANNMQDATNGFGGNGYGNLVIGVNESAADGNQIRGNNLKCGFGFGIVLAGNTGSQGNNGIATPSITSTTGTTIFGTAPPLSSVDIYVASLCNDVYGKPKGETYITTATSQADGSWNFNLASFSLPCPVLLTATATKVVEGTSEFSSEFEYCGSLVTPPVASFTGDQTNICVNGCVDFTNTSTGGPFTSVRWVFDSLAASTLANPTLCFGAAGSYYVRLIVTNSIGSDTLQIPDFIVVSEAQELNTDFTYPNPICIDGLPQTPIGLGNLTPGGTYSIEPADVTIDPATGLISAENGIPGFYTVYYTVEAGGCGSSGGGVGTFPFELDSIPALQISTTSDLSICNSESITLTASPNFASYNWQGVSSNTATAIITEAGEYSVIVSTPNGCSVNSDTIVVTGGGLPTASFTYLQSSGYVVDFSNTSNLGASYLWDFGSGFTSTQENPSYNFLYDNTWPVRLIVTNICGSDTLDTTVVVVKTGISEIGASNLSISEQAGTLNIQSANAFETGTVLSLNSLSGQLVAGKTQTTSNQTCIQLPTQQLSPGIYFITLQSPSKHVTLKWLKTTDY